MQYEKMNPPFESISFVEMNKKQAQEYFEWYMNQINIRISLLKSEITKDGENMDFDFSVESLIPLWNWYRKKITFRELSENEYNDLIHSYPDWMKEHISRYNLSYETLLYGEDVAIYFAQVFIHNNPTIKWGYFTKPKNRASVNEPTLLGFKYDKDLNPRLIIENITRRADKENQGDSLFDIYQVWLKYV